MEKNKKIISRPTIEALEQEIKRVHYKEKYKKTLRSTIFTLITVAAVAVLVATLFLPILQIYGNSMTPTLEDGDLILSVKESHFQKGDVIAFYYNNKILVKRVIATSGEWVDMDDEGNVFVNGELLEESYVKDKAFGECNIPLPYQVPEDKIFVMGDHRSVSVDSRHTSVGCVAEEQIVGELEFRIWPLSAIGAIE